MSTHTGRLLLCTQDPFLLPKQTLLRATLTEAGLLGTPLAGREGAFVPGERFLQLVTFAGCSVQVQLSPSADNPFCHILLSGPFERPRFLFGRNTRPPRCRGCRSPLRDWRPILAAWHRGGPADIRCPSCGEMAPLWTYDWKEHAGYGRQFVQIEEVFPGEAAPAPGLIGLLESSTRQAWRYFYIQDQ